MFSFLDFLLKEASTHVISFLNGSRPSGTGVGVGARKEIYQLINEFKKDGLSILMVSSDMPEVLGMSDRILVMREGAISAEFSRAEADQEKLLAAAIGKH